MGKGKNVRRVAAYSPWEATPSPAPVENEEEFASQFTSPAFRIRVGPAQKEYYLHKDVLTKRSPFFKGMLASSFTGKEVADNTVVMDSPVDREDAFDMFVEFVYMSAYIAPEIHNLAQRCILHARVYVLAERLCMNDLKDMALAKMKGSLIESFESKFQPIDNRLHPASIMELIDIVYEGTPGKVEPRQERNSSLTSRVSLDKELEDKAPEMEAFPEVYAAPEFPTRVLSPQLVEAPADDAPAEDALADEAEYAPAEAPTEDTLAEDIPAEEFPTDRMRALIAQYAASTLDKLQQNSDFLSMVQGGGDFVVDLIKAAAKEPNRFYL